MNQPQITNYHIKAVNTIINNKYSEYEYKQSVCQTDQT